MSKFYWEEDYIALYSPRFLRTDLGWSALPNRQPMGLEELSAEEETYGAESYWELARDVKLGRQDSASPPLGPRRRKHKTLTLNGHSRRAQKRGGAHESIDAGWWFRWCVAWGWRCAYCGEPEKFPDIEHIIPISRGGPHVRWNIVPSCKRCNSSKHTQAAREWLSETRLAEFLSRAQAAVWEMVCPAQD